MENLILQVPIRTLDNRVLVPEGLSVSPATLKEIVSAGAEFSRRPRRSSLLGYGSVREDLRGYLGAPPYNVIFFDSGEVNKLLRAIENVEVLPAVLTSLDYFKQHDAFTYRHILLVYALSALLANDLVTDRDAWEAIVNTGPTHDFGKICAPLGILRKTTPLTPSEREILQDHTIAGFVLLSYYLGDAGNLTPLVARDHHERRNGTGYPRKIDQRNIMVEIIAVADIYDALISPRPYRPVSFDNRTALEEITAMADRGEIGWDVVKALVARNRGSRFEERDWDVSGEKRGTPPAGNVYGITAAEDP